MYQKKLGPECWAIAKMGEQPKSFAMCTVCWMVTLQCIRDLCPTTGETGTGMSLVMGWMVYFQFRSLVLYQEDQVQDSSRHIFLVGQPRRSQCSWCATLTGQPDFRSPTSLLMYLEGHPCMPDKELKTKQALLTGFKRIIQCHHQFVGGFSLSNINQKRLGLATLSVKQGAIK